MPRVSVIATFYNLEAFVERCVSSLLNQTFDDYELILVDDGSTDATSTLLDRYEANRRVSVLHLDNGGTSRARNRGLRQASGELVSFVDGDDFVSPDYLRSLYEPMKIGACDLVVGGNLVVAEKAAAQLTWHAETTSSSVLYDRKDLIHALLYEQVTEAPWGKLARRELYERQPFPPDRMYEDVAVAGRHGLSVNRAVLLKRPLYAYVMRNGSVVHRRNASERQVRDFLWAIEQFLEPLRSAYPELSQATCYREALELLRVHSLLSTVERPERERLADISVAVMARLKALYPIVRKDVEAPRHTKVRLGVCCTMPSLYDWLFIIYERHVKGISRGM